MAVIPTGRFGYDVAAPASSPVPPPGTIDTGGGFGAIGQAVGNIAAERDQEARVARDAADRARAIVQMGEAKQQMKDLATQHAEGVLSGTMDRDASPQEFGQQARALLEDFGADLPENTRVLAKAELENDILGMASGIEDAGTRRAKLEVDASLDTMASQYERAYADGDMQAEQKMQAYVDAMWEQSTRSPADAVRFMEGWREGTQFSSAARIISENKDSPRALGQMRDALNSERFSGIGEDKRLRLMERIDAYEDAFLRRQQMAEERAAREESLRIQRAGATYEAASKLFDEGVFMNPDQVAIFESQMVGTPYAQAFRSMVAAGQQGASLGAMSVPQLQRSLQAANARIGAGGVSEAAVDARDRVQRVLEAKEAAYKEDPWAAAQRYGDILQIPDVDLRTAETAIATLSQRVAMLPRVAGGSGRTESPLRPAEAVGLTTALGGMNPTQRAAYLAGVAKVLPASAMGALNRQLGEADASRDIVRGAMLASHRSTSGKSVAEIYFRGRDLVTTNAVPKGVDERAARDQLSQRLQGVYSTGGGSVDALESAYAIWLGMGGKSNDYQEAADLVTGGVWESDAGRVRLPYGMPESDFQERFGRITPNDIRNVGGETFSVGGQVLNAEQLHARLGGARLDAVNSRGMYRVELGGALVMRTDGRPLVLGLDRIGKPPPPARQNPHVYYPAGRAPAGLVQPGNLELWDRPTLRNPDGSVSTTRSMSVGTDAGEVLIPTVVDGVPLTPDQAVMRFQRTNEHLGIFRSAAEADQYAQRLHEEQARRMGLEP